MASEDRVTRAGTPERWSRIVTYKPNAEGRVEGIRDDGFEDSNLVHEVAWQVIHRDAAEAWRQVREGRKSPLYYHMVANLLNPQMLAREVGMWTWRVRRHFRPGVFASLKPSMLQKYAGALRLTVQELASIPPEPPPVDPPSPGTGG